MIEPEAATRWAREARFDRAAAILIGLLAVLAAVLTVVQAGYGQASTRAQLQAARITTDASARVSAGGLAGDATLRAQQDAVLVGLEAVNRMIAATTAGDGPAVAVGTAQQQASEALRAALEETAATSGGPPLDAYAAGLVTASQAELEAVVAEQNRLVDAAEDAGGRELRAVFGLALLALAAVLAGVAAVMREGRTGWLLLGVAWLVAGGAALAAILAVA